MKRILLCLSVTLYFVQANAQYTPFPTMDSLDINNIHASVLVHGDMWWDPDAHTMETMPKCNLYGTARNVNFAGAIWMSGFDAGNNLHVSAQTYRQTGMDYWPGPLEDTGAEDYTTSQKWAKIWKVNGADVSNFNAINTHTTLNTPVSILTWPGNGNVYASGNAGAPLTVTRDMAPFVDLNGNGIYEPLLGDYPDFPGDQVLWWVFNDNGPIHNQTNGTQLGVEVHVMNYGYKRGTLLDNVVYYDYKIVNRSANDYHDMRMGIFDDMDLGWYYDDFIGFDSSRRLGIGYNGTNDDGAGGGHPLNSFGARPPMMGVTMIALPGDSEEYYIPAGGFTYYNNDCSTLEYPMSDSDIYYCLNGKTKNGANQPYDYLVPRQHDSNIIVPVPGPYIFPGDPGDRTQWSECSVDDIPADRRFVISSNDFSLPAGSFKHIVAAMVVTDTGIGGCPGTSFARIRDVSDTAWAGYHNPPTSLHKHTPNGDQTEIQAYPNPSHDKVFITAPDNTTITVYNSTGQSFNIPVTKNGSQYELDISTLPHGLYNAVCNGRSETKFLKQ